MAKQGQNGIAWTEQTWNPIRGCSRVSEGCRNCYAEKVAGRFSGIGQPYHGLARIHDVMENGILRGEARWTGKIDFVEKHLLDPLRWRKPRMIFVNSMSDLFHENVKEEWIDKIFTVMALAKHHTFQILTKRPERMREQVLRISKSINPLEDFARSIGYTFNFQGHSLLMWPIRNIWLGVSVENQETADERIPTLLNTPAAIHWVSYEPALDYVDFSAIRVLLPTAFFPSNTPAADREIKLDWIVCGDESGPRARPAELGWYRMAREYCWTNSIAFFQKQICKDGHKIPYEQFPADLQVREYPRREMSC